LPSIGGVDRPVFAALGAALGVVLAVACAIAVVGVVLYKAPGPKAKVGAATTVILAKGAHTSEIAADLERAGVIRSGAIFMAAAEVSGAAKALKAGEYAFPSKASLAAVIRRMRSGEVVHHRVTIPEGTTSRQAVDILMHVDVLTGDIPTPPEGALLPETYDVVRGESRATVLQRMMDADDRLLVQLWAHRRKGLPYTNIEQAVILASIVEKETALDSERPRVAAVYLNRLSQGMKLEADPTIIYGLNGGAPLGHGIRESELKADTPYNTYMNPGLPPTPIDNPGRASLAAAMDPPVTEDVYFVADGTGGHAFSKTLAEHAQNVQRWRRIEQQRAQAEALAGAPQTRPPQGDAEPMGAPLAPMEHR
jgi:UPF0755 protein